MHHAYELALKGWGKVSPNPMVGAVVIKSGKVIAQGWHSFCGGPHAEAMALTKAGAKAKGADLYITLEPCSHYGRTPPCTNAIIKAGIKRVFVGVRDPNPRMNGQSIKLLKKAGITVEVGFLAEELIKLNEVFDKYIRTGMPFVTAKIAQTIDGRIATLKGESQWITSVGSRQYGRNLRQGVDAILVGVNTVIKDNPRLEAEPRKPYFKVILDTHLKTPVHAKLFTGTKPEQVLIFTAARKNKPLKATIIQAPLKQGRIDLKWVLSYLAKQEIAHVLIEGGGQVIGNALTNQLIDKMMIYVAPKLMGEGLSGVSGLKIKDLKQMITITNMTTMHLGDDMLVVGYLKL